MGATKSILFAINNFPITASLNFTATVSAGVKAGFDGYGYQFSKPFG